MADGGRQRKRQKWDVASPMGQPIGPGGGGSLPSNAAFAPTFAPQGYRPPAPQVQQPAGPPPEDVIARAKQGAMSVLEKINQDLRMKGAAPLKGGFGQRGDEERIRREVTINDAPGPIRYKLTLRTTQDDIARRTGTVVVVRGRFLPPGMPNNGEEPPLHLKITPGVTASESDEVQQQAVDAAAREVQHILNGGQPGTYVQPYPLPRPAQGGGPQQYPPPQSYGSPNYPGSVPHPSGPGGQGMNGPGMGRGGMGYPGPRPQGSSGPPSGYQGVPQGHSAPGNSYAQVPPPHQASYQAQQAPGAGAPGPGGAAQAVPLYVGIKGTPEFPLADKLRGPDGAFLKHIASVSGTQVVLKGVGSGNPGTDPLHIFIAGGTQEGNNKAVELAKNLLDTVRKEHQAMYPNGPPKPQPTPQPGIYAQHPGSYRSQASQGQYRPSGQEARPQASYPNKAYPQQGHPAHNPAPAAAYHQPGPQGQGPQPHSRPPYHQQEPHPHPGYPQAQARPNSGASYPHAAYPSSGPQAALQSHHPGNYGPGGAQGAPQHHQAAAAPYAQQHGQPGPRGGPATYPTPGGYPQRTPEAQYPLQNQGPAQYPPSQGGPRGPAQGPPSNASYPQQPPASYGQQSTAQQGYQGYGQQQPYSAPAQAGTPQQGYPYPAQGGYAPRPAPQQPGGYQQGANPQQQQQQYPPTQQQASGSQQGPPSGSNGATGGGEAEGQQQKERRRFREFKETPAPAPSMPAPYAPHQMKAPQNPGQGSMGPPPPRNPGQGTMGPPPPRPRPNAGQGGGAENPKGSMVSGSLAGLVDYD